MRTNEKKGISLIVLVLTIIVMIILASAIILSVSNSGIIGKANKAKQDSDTANLKEYVNVLVAEWELQSEETESYSSKEAYVNTKLSEKGYKRRLNEDGILLMENTVEAIDAGIKIGDVVTGYTLDDSTSKKSYPTSGNENTAPTGTGSEGTPTKKTVTRIEYTTWKYIGISDDGEILIAPDMVPSVTENQKITLSGKGGYLNGPDELDDMCEAMYSTSKGTARSMNIDDITRILDYTGMYYYNSVEGTNVYTTQPKKIRDIGTFIDDVKTPDGKDIGDYYTTKNLSVHKESSDILKSASDDLKTKLKKFVFTDNTYWIASRFLSISFKWDACDFCVYYADSEDISSSILFGSGGDSIGDNYIARPVVSLSSDATLKKLSAGNWSL